MEQLIFPFAASLSNHEWKNPALFRQADHASTVLSTNGLTGS